MVKQFAEKHLLKLNVTKSEITVFTKRQGGADNLLYDVDSVVVPSGDAGKCLGYWWKGDLLSSLSMLETCVRAS